MKRLHDARVVLTGAAGGIGTEIAKELVRKQCRVGLVGRNKVKLDELAEELKALGGDVLVIPADITHQSARKSIVDAMINRYQGIDVLINNAALMSFKEFEHQDDADIEALFTTNLISPILLTKELLPALKKSPKAHIINMGSTFGSIAFACYSTYSASKFGIRGFSESLRRELEGTSVMVSYFAPRAVKTTLNSSKVYEMARKIKMNMDEPEWIAKKVVHAIVKNKKEAYFGFPESIFVRINSILPRLVDKALSGQTRIMKQYCD